MGYLKQAYAEGSTYSGRYITDLVKFGDSDPMNMTIGCHSSETGLFLTQEANGILGFALSNNNKSNLVSQLYQSNAIDQQILTFCLGINGDE